MPCIASRATPLTNRFSLAIGAAFVGAVALLSGPTASRAADRPNILWLITEDMGPELACYGTTQVETPNIDRLAAEGVRFTRAFSTAPVCSASRSAFITGMYQTTIGAHNHRSHRDDGFGLPDGVEIISR
jgi:N-sulfoglucosamine sulfohydrolase